ncbi:MAG: branched-chain amino acid ABC transporter permease [Alphaproteobacteria bacterium]
MIEKQSDTRPKSPPSSRSANATGWILLILGGVAVPFVLSGFQLFQISQILVYAIALLGLNFLSGYSGQISIGHGAFFALGAYTAAILSEHFGVSFYLAVPAAALVCLCVGFLFGLPALRLEGLYLALATFALAVATPQVLKYKAFEDLTGGVQGIYMEKPNAPFGIPLDSDQWTYFLCFAVCVVMFVLGRNMMRGRVGRALVAIRDHSTAAQTMGVNAALYKSVTFGVSALYAGVAGALSCVVVQFVAPDSFGMFVSITFFVGSIVGGVTSISGAIYGAIFIQFLPNIAGHLSKSAPWAIYGVLLIAVVYFMPNGVAGAVKSLQKGFVDRRAGSTPKAANQSQDKS